MIFFDYPNASARRILSNIFIGLLLCLLVSCSRAPVEKQEETGVVWVGAVPMAILQPGEYPLWFQLTEEGPVLIETVEDAVFSRALIPWPLALHIRFLQETEDGLVMVINRDGFLKLAVYDGTEPGLALYHFSGGEFWQQYTIGGFVFFEGKPAALLYLDTRFLNSSVPVPQPRTWTFNMESNIPFPLEIPALRFFPEEDGWDADTLRKGGDDYWYYRMTKKNSSLPAVRMFRTDDLTQAGKEISTDVFYSSAVRETAFTHPFLPSLPEGFCYTAIGWAGESLFAAWEEQEDFSIGAAGFVVIKR